MSDSEFLKMAESEVQRLEAEIALTPLYQRLTAARGVVEVYKRNERRVLVQGQHGADFGRSLPKTFALPDSDAVTERGGFGEKILERTKARKIEEAAVSYFSRAKCRATSGQLLEVMTNYGIEIGGREPNKALSAYLSGIKTLNNVREFGGYGLAEWGIAAGPDLLTKSGA